MKRILIVDDEQPILFILSRAFSKRMMTVDTSFTLEDAIAKVDQNRYDTVITDLRLTNNFGREGLDLLEYLKKNHPECRVIMITGNGSNAIEEEFIAKGGDLYLEKPVDIEILSKNI